MRIKKYVSDSMAGALRLVKADLGPRAVILNTRTIKKGGALGIGGKGQVEVTAAVDQAKTRPKASPVGSPDRPAKTLQPAVSLPATTPPGESQRQTRPQRRQTSGPAADTQPNGVSSKWADRIARQLDELQTSVQNSLQSSRKPSAIAGPGLTLPGALGALSSQLAEAGVAPDLTQEILMAILLEPGPEGLKSLRPLQKHAAGLLADRTGEPSIARMAKGVRTVIALVGPAGAGKTTAAARLAAHYASQYGARPALVAADTERVGGLEQLKAYAGILQVPVDAVYTPDDMADVIRKRRDVDLILVDTGGASPHNEDELRQLGELLREAAPSEIHLVMGATTGLPQMFDTVEAFTRIGADHLLLTKLDETFRLGAACTVASESSLPLSFFTDGRNVPGNISPADPKRLAQRLFERSPNGAAS